MHDVVRFGKLLTDPLSLRMLNLLRQGELCACEIEASFQGGAGTIRGRLEKLRRACLVKASRRSIWASYAIAPKYSDLVETVFEVFEADIAYDEGVVLDERRLAAELEKRVDGWCEDPRYDSEGHPRRVDKPASGA